MKRKWIITTLLIAALAAAGIFIYREAIAKPAPALRLAKIERGDVRQTVSATGTLNAVTTVSVGTQVSGQVAELLVDFNDHVTKGQLLARIDPTLAQQAVVDAQANLDKARAQLLQGQRDYARNRELTSSGLLARSAFEQSEASFDVARAQVKSAQVALDRAGQNLAYTNIHAPIDGVVVERNVQQGQTVAASLSAPQLFLIANDLAHMEILAQVGESDIAQIQQGQMVTFSVQALPNQTFKGTVRQVRLQSTTSDNVVNYTVVIAVENAQNKLLPGMTARVELQTQTATNVLKVPNAALRFKPSDEQIAQLRLQVEPDPVRTTTATGTSAASTATSTSAATGRAARAGSRNGQSGGPRPSLGTLYFIDKNGKLARERVPTGVTDGATTEIKPRKDSVLAEGMNVIAGIAAPSATATATSTASSNPFGQSGSQSSGGRRGGI